MIESRTRFAVVIATVVVMVGCGGTSSESTGGTAAAGGTGGIAGTGGASGMGGTAGMGGASGMGGAAGEGGTGGVIPMRQWGTAILIEAGNEDASGPQVAFDTSGNAVAVWFQSDGTNGRIWASWYVPTQGWATPELISPAMVTSAVPRVGADSSGNAIAVWRQQTGLFGAWANRYTQGTGWGTAEDIGAIDTAAGDFAIEVAVNPDGDAMSVWHQGDGVRKNIWANRFTSVGGWQTAELIESDDAGGVQWPRVAIDPNGDAVAVWEQSDGTRTNIWANQYVAGLGWATAKRIETEDLGDASRAQVAVDPDGNAIAVWYQHDGTRFNVWANRLE